MKGIIIKNRPKTNLLFFLKKAAFAASAIVFIVFTLFACKSNNNNNSVLSTSAGKTNEILVVINRDLWKSYIGDSIKSVFNEVKPWFAQEEPEFDLMQIETAAFIDTYQKYRNVVIVKIDHDLSTNSVKAKANVFAKPQTIVEFKCKSNEDFLKLFSENFQKVKTLFHENEFDRITESYGTIKVDSITNVLKVKFGFSMVCPEGFYVAVNKKDFVWIRKVIPDIEFGILVYRVPYADTADFSVGSIILRRDTMTKKYIPGPMDSTWMKVSSVFPYYSETTTFHNQYATLVRSWWDVNNYPMGGPFLSYTFVDTATSQLITIDGFIKAPRKNKRNLLTQIESIINTFQWVPKNEAKP